MRDCHWLRLRESPTNIIFFPFILSKKSCPLNLCVHFYLTQNPPMAEPGFIHKKAKKCWYMYYVYIKKYCGWVRHPHQFGIFTSRVHVQCQSYLKVRKKVTYLNMFRNKKLLGEFTSLGLPSILKVEPISSSISPTIKLLFNKWTHWRLV